MIKKRIRSIFLTVLLCLFVVAPVYAQGEHQLPRLVDNAGLLSDADRNELLKELDKTSEEYNCDVAIVTVNSLEGKTATEYADDVYDYNGYGMGSGNDGILFLISMGERDWAITTYGYAISVFTDAEQEYITEQIMPDLSNGYYKEAFSDFAFYSGDLLQQAESDELDSNENPWPQAESDKLDNNENPWPQAESDKLYNNGNSSPKSEGSKLDSSKNLLQQADSDKISNNDNSQTNRFSPLWILSSLGGGMFLALCIMTWMESKLKTVGFQKNASTYVKSNSLNITTRNDRFLYNKVDKQAKPKKKSSSGLSTHRSTSGNISTTHRSSSGRSHGGSSGKF
jgi:uncharacterized protein